MSVVEFICDKIVWNGLFVAAVLGCGVYFSLRYRMRHITGLFDIKTAFGGAGGGGISPFRIFALTTGGKIGVGNIVGVSLALRSGGAGAVLWLAVFSLLGAAISYAECRLGAEVGGGPPVYMRRLGWVKISSVFSVLLFAVQAVFIPAIQINSAARAVTGLAGKTGDPLWGAVAGAGFALLFLLCVKGGKKKIATASAYITSPACVIYILIVLAVIAVNYRRLPAAFGQIFTSALSRQALFGGGAATAFAVGSKRAAFTGEAGYGIAPCAAARADSPPDSQGVVQSLSVLTDTLFMCCLTAIMLLVSGTPDPSEAAAALLGSAAAPTVAVLTVIFAFTTVLCCGFITAELCGEGGKIWAFAVMAGIMVCAGAAAPEIVWPLCDITGGIMMRLNLAAVLASVRHPAGNTFKPQLPLKQKMREKPIRQEGFILR